MELEKSLLFSAQKVNEDVIQNRWVVAPMTRISAEDDGTANKRMLAYYERYAKGGFGAIITEGIYTDKKYSQGYLNQPGLASEAQRDAWKPIVKTVQQHETKMIAQLMHAGGQSQGNRYSDETAAPSAIPPKGEQLGFYGGSGPFMTPKEMTKQEIDEAKEGFVKAARYAKEAGFDGVEIHGANGYLLDQFLTDYLNKREDEYGGSLEKRLRLPVEVIQAVRKETGKDYMVGIRVSQAKVADATHKWAGGQKDAEVIFSALAEAGVDYIHVTDADGAAPGFGEGTMTMAEAARTYGNVRVIANGQLNQPDTALKMIEEEQTDFISLGTGALANPDFPNRMRQGKAFDEFNFKEILLPQAEVKDKELEMPVLSGRE